MPRMNEAERQMLSVIADISKGMRVDVQGVALSSAVFEFEAAEKLFTAASRRLRIAVLQAENHRRATGITKKESP